MKKVFGIASICPVVVLDDSNWDNLCQELGEYVEAMYPDKNFTFKVEAKRADKKYPLTSPEICSEMGAYLLGRFPELKVDVRKPKVRLL